MESFEHECNGCGRTFTHTNAFSNHQRTCKKSKARLSSVLATARENWTRLKRARISGPKADLPHAYQLSPTQSSSTSSSSSHTILPSTSHPNATTLSTANPLLFDLPSSSSSATPLQATIAEANEVTLATFFTASSWILIYFQTELDITDTRPLAQRKPHRQRVAPQRYQDNPPEPPRAFPPTQKFHNQERSATLRSTVNTHPSTLSLGARVRSVFQTPWNIFGLSRKYIAHEAPNHDPEDHNDLTDLNDCIDPEYLEPSVEPQSFYPYPNKNSFLLGSWYWCDGAQKSQESFKSLINIVGDPGFSPEDVRHTRWDQIDKTLGNSGFEGEEWEDVDAGWIKSLVTIRIPIPRESQKESARHTGPQDYTLGHFYHRSIVSVIREKLSNPSDDRLFHYEPFELLWRPSHISPKTTRVHSELYCSSEFLRVHNDLQESPMEPGCSLPRVVVALMFWSDATHLTSFGNTKLWPLYMGFGNESKYRRCRPSLSLLNHLAYFERVAFLLSAYDLSY